MQQLQGFDQHVCNYVLADLIACIFLIGQSGLGKLNVPVAEDIPNEIVEHGERNAQLVLVKVGAHALNRLVQLGQNPLVLGCKRILGR